MIGDAVKPMTLWLTGLSGAGKSTLAAALQATLKDKGVACGMLDGDRVRRGLSRDLGFSASDRSENARRVAEVSRLMNEAGLVVIASLVSPYRRDREMAQLIVGEENFAEIYLSTPLEICQQRDPKGLYRRARENLLPHFTGVSDPFEPPLKPVLRIDTSIVSVPEALPQLFSLLLAAPR